MPFCIPRPYKAKGSLRTAGASYRNRPSAEGPPSDPKKVMPVNVASACLDLEFITTIESDDEGREEEVQIEIESAPRSPMAREVPASG